MAPFTWDVTQPSLLNRWWMLLVFGGIPGIPREWIRDWNYQGGSGLQTTMFFPFVDLWMWATTGLNTKKNLDVSAVMLAQNSVSVVSFISFLIFPEHQRREVSNDRNNGSHLQLGAESDPCHGAFGGNIKVESCCESWRFLIHWFWGAVVCFESCESLSLRRCSNLKLASEKKEWCTRPPPCWSSMLNFPTVSILILH